MQMMRDKIIIKDIKIFAYHGVLKEEKVLGQNFIINLEMYTSLKKAGKSDSIDDTVNYAEIYEKVEKIAKSKSYDLIEALAEDISIMVLEYEMINNVKVEVQKPSVAINGNLAYSAVEIYR